MASFVPYYKKKHLQFREVEGELMALLQKNEPEKTALKAVEQVRAAKIRAIREKMAKLAASEESIAARNKWQKEIEELQALPAAEILQTYRRKVAGLKTPVVIHRAPQRGHW
jgi:uncharacterized membrane protein YcjF (UPF0283 family)